jgi:Fe-S-cluster containining protein
MNEKEILKICKKCGAKCCKLGGADLGYSETRKINKGLKGKLIKINSNHYWTGSFKNGACIYLKKNNSCKIHNNKPLVCSCWPLHLSPNSKKIKIAKCPLTEKLSKKDIIKLTTLIKKCSPNYFRNYWKKSKLPKCSINKIKRNFKRFKL